MWSGTHWYIWSLVRSLEIESWDTSSPEVASQRRHAIDAQCRCDPDHGNPMYCLPSQPAPACEQINLIRSYEFASMVGAITGDTSMAIKQKELTRTLHTSSAMVEHKTKRLKHTTFKKIQQKRLSCTKFFNQPSMEKALCLAALNPISPSSASA